MGAASEPVACPQLPMEAMGMLGLVKLAHATKNASYVAMSERPLSYTLAETTLFQADHVCDTFSICVLSVSLIQKV